VAASTNGVIPMHPTVDSLGACPRCGASIPARQLLIKYERDDETAVYAECPDCTAVVHPT